MKITSFKKLFALSITALALAFAGSANAALEPELVTKDFIAGPITMTTGTASNAVQVAAKTLSVEPGQDVGITFNMAGSGASTANEIAYFKYRCGSKGPWSTELVSATKALAGTANVVATVTLTNGIHFPSTTTDLCLSYVTNSSGVTAYHTNLVGSTWKLR